MPQFCILFYANYTILATQRGGHGPVPPLNTPLGTLTVEQGLLEGENYPAAHEARWVQGSQQRAHRNDTEKSACGRPKTFLFF